MSAQHCNKYREWKRCLTLLNPHGHLLLYDESLVQCFPSYYESEKVHLRVLKDGLILQRHDRTVNKHGPVPSDNVQVLPLDGSSCLNPPQGGVRN